MSKSFVSFCDRCRSRQEYSNGNTNNSNSNNDNDNNDNDIIIQVFPYTFLFEDSKGVVVSDQWTTSNCLLLTCTYSTVQYNVRVFVYLMKVYD